MKIETLGFWVEGIDFQSESEVLSIFAEHTQRISRELGCDPDYNGVGPWRGYAGPPLTRLITLDISKTIQIAVWRNEVGSELALCLIAADADTWMTLERVWVEAGGRRWYQLW